jgi:hypothetical protein
VDFDQQYVGCGMFATSVIVSDGLPLLFVLIVQFWSATMNDDCRFAFVNASVKDAFDEDAGNVAVVAPSVLPESFAWPLIEPDAAPENE